MPALFTKISILSQSGVGSGGHRHPSTCTTKKQIKQSTTPQVKSSSESEPDSDTDSEREHEIDQALAEIRNI